MVASARILLLLTRLKELIRRWKVGQVPAHPPLALLDFPVRRLFRLYCCSAEWGQHSLGFLVRSFGLTQVAFAGDRQDGPTSAVSSTAPLQALPLYSPGFSEPASQGGNPRVWGLWGYPAQFVQRQWGTIWGRESGDCGECKSCHSSGWRLRQRKCLRPSRRRCRCNVRLHALFRAGDGRNSDFKRT